MLTPVLHRGTATAGRGRGHQAWVRPLGSAAVLFSVLYLATDVAEAIQGGFSTSQLWATLVAEAAIPVIVVGLAVASRARLGRLGLVGAALYAYSYVYFTGTVAYALAHGTSDYAALSDALDPWMIIHGGLMVAGGLALGVALLRDWSEPRLAPALLIVGVVLVAATQTAPAWLQVVVAGVRDLGIAGLGLQLSGRLTRRRK